MNVVLDTNVLVSALWSKDGTPAKILLMVPDRKITPCYCEKILNEYKAVLSRPAFSFKPEKVELLIENFVKFGRNVSAPKSSFPLPDESDRVFYDVAKTADAILITGNKKHFPNEPFIVNPAEFVSKITCI